MLDKSGEGRQRRPGRARNAAAECKGTGAPDVRAGDGDDQLQLSGRFQAGRRQLRRPDHPQRRRWRTGGAGVGASDAAVESYGGRQSVPAAGQKVSPGGQEAPVRPGAGHRGARHCANDHPRRDVSLRVQGRFGQL